MNQSDVALPLIIKDDRVHFETLKNMDIRVIDTPIFQRIGIEVHISITSITILIIIIMLSYMIYDKKI